MIRSQLGMVLVLGALTADSCPSTPPKPPILPDAGDAGAQDASYPKDAAVILADSSLVIVDAAVSDGRVATLCERACFNLKVIACPEGIDPRCVVTCERTEAARLTALHPDCLAAAPTKTAARACRSVACP